MSIRVFIIFTLKASNGDAYSYEVECNQSPSATINEHRTHIAKAIESGVNPDSISFDCFGVKKQYKLPSVLDWEEVIFPSLVRLWEEAYYERFGS